MPNLILQGNIIYNAYYKICINQLYVRNIIYNTYHRICITQFYLGNIVCNTHHKICITQFQVGNITHSTYHEIGMTVSRTLFHRTFYVISSRGFMWCFYTKLQKRKGHQKAWVSSYELCMSTNQSSHIIADLYRKLKKLVPGNWQRTWWRTSRAVSDAVFNCYSVLLILLMCDILCGTWVILGGLQRSWSPRPAPLQSKVWQTSNAYSESPCHH